MQLKRMKKAFNHLSKKKLQYYNLQKKMIINFVVMLQ